LVFFLPLISFLVSNTLTAWKKATSSRSALASSRVQHNVKALDIARAVSQNRFLPLGLSLTLKD
jgi:hypothetical protein